MLRPVFKFAFLMMLVAACLSAASITYGINFPNPGTTPSGADYPAALTGTTLPAQQNLPFTLARFDLAGFTLTGITLQFYSNVTASGTVSNPGSPFTPLTPYASDNDYDYYLSLRNLARIVAPDVTASTLQNSALDEIKVATGGPAPTFATGTTNYAASSLNVTKTTSLTLSSQVLADYTGSGNVNFTMLESSSLAATIGGSMSTTNTGNFNGWFTVTYDYSPTSSTPEPGTIAMALGGVMCLVLGVRRRKA